MDIPDISHMLSSTRKAFLLTTTFRSSMDKASFQGVARYANNLSGQIIAGYIQINHLFAMLFNLKA
jgi:hypothetical protein